MTILNVNGSSTASGTNTGDQTLVSLGAEATATKDATGGYAGLTLFKINFKNAANTFTNFLTNASSAARTYTFPDKDITVSGVGDDLVTSKTITTAGTTGAQTINKSSGSVNFAALATSLVVTNNLVTANSIILCTIGTVDVTMNNAVAVAGNGSFTITANAAATAETRVNFVVIN